MAGKTCVVTGATSGIGLATATELARRGARVTIVGRSVERTSPVAEAIRRESRNEGVEFLAADLSVLSQVRRLAAEVLERHTRIDVLVNNAGVMLARRRETADGLEMTLAVNHLAPFLLTNLLLERLKASAPARIVTTASGAHRDAKAFPFDDPQAEGGWYTSSEGASVLYTLLLPWRHPGFQRYAQTKLANILFTRELAARLAGTGVTANTLHPGLVKTGIASNNGTFGWFVRTFLGLAAVSPEAGARTVVHLACSPEVEGVTGGYFENEQPATPTPAAQDDAAARRLWALSEELTGLPATGPAGGRGV